MNAIEIRRATATDLASLVEFNCAMARETEELELHPDVVTAGVRAIFENPSRGFYLVAEYDAQVVAGLLITNEWSDWRNGLFWWVQSVYVLPAYRRQGIYRRMYEWIKRQAGEDDQVCGFRLYVERDNAAAQAAYQQLGMTQTPYILFEELAGSSRHRSR